MKGNFNLTEICTPVCAEVLAQYLEGYSADDKEFVLRGFREGFHLNSSIDKKVTIETNNMPSAEAHPEIVWEKITKEVNDGRVAGPFDRTPFEHYICSPLGLVPKAGSPNKFHLIFNLSAGKVSVNSCTMWQHRTTKYRDLNDAVKLLQEIGPEAKLGKADLEAAFRQTPIHPNYWSLLVFKARGPAGKQW